MNHESCEGCFYDLGGGRDNCTLGVASECRDGGGFEAWTPKNKFDDDNNIVPLVTLVDIMPDFSRRGCNRGRVH